MAIATPCQTSGAVFSTSISDFTLVDTPRTTIDASVTLPFALGLTEAAAEILEANIHNALELVLAPYFL